MRRKQRWEPYEFEALATYNSEKARGIVHTPEWVEKMKHEQERFNQQQWWYVKHDGHVRA